MPLAASLLLAATPARLPSQVAADDSVVARLERIGTPVETPRARAWVEPGTLTPEAMRAFAEQLSAGVASVERAVGRSLDRARYGTDRIQVYVTSGLGPSHVYGGYAHARYPRPYLFLDAARVRAGQAPYLHEITHLVAWKSGSHSLREGLASWIESHLSARGEGTHSGLFGVRNVASADSLARRGLASDHADRVLPSIGRAGSADQAITAAPVTREAYYIFSQSFVAHLVEQLGLRSVLTIMEADDTDAAYLTLTGKPLVQWQAAWRQALGRDHDDMP